MAAAAGPLDGSDYSIAVDGPSRSLVVRAEPRIQRAIREVLEVLDQQPELIAVDITISELRTPKNYGLSFGFQLPFATGDDGSDLFGFVNSQPTIAGVNAIPTLFGRVQRDTGVSFVTEQGGVPVTVPVLQSGNIAALDFRGSNEVLIQPSLVVAAGAEHEIFVGDNLPVPVTDTGGDGQTVGGVDVSALTRTTRFDRKDVGTRLLIDARSGKDGKIQLGLEIELTALDLSRAGLGGDPFVVGPSFVEQRLVVTARLDDGENAVLALSRRESETKVSAGIPFLRDLPFFGWAFRTQGSIVEDIRLVIAAKARRVSNPAELVADTIRRRLAFARRNARGLGLPHVNGPPYGVRVTTRRRLDDAVAIADSLSFRGYETKTHKWMLDDETYHDVYVTQFASMADAAEVASELSKDGWQADLVVFKTGTR